MANGLIIAFAGLAAVAAAALLLRRHREQSELRALAQRRGWVVYSGRQKDLQARLGGLALMQVAHSRRIAGAFRAAGRAYLFAYDCETGFEHQRRCHRWIVAAHEVEHPYGRATITSLDWLRATAMAPAYEALPVENGTTRGGGPVAIVEDAEQWRQFLKEGLGRWLAGQPPRRTWEILPGFVVGYEPGRLQDDALADLAVAAEELVRELSRLRTRA